MAVMLEVLTDNKNRTVAEIRHAFSKNGGNLGENGCVAWMFDRVGNIRIVGEDLDEDRVFELAAESGATDVRAEDEGYCVVTEVETLEDVRTALDGADGIEVESAEIVLEPKNFVTLSGSDAAQALRLLDVLEDHEDVQRVSANFDIDEEELGRLSA